MQYRGLELDTFQADAIAALAEGRTVLVCAPTGTGKSLIADWLVERVLAAGKEVVYTAPIKALSNQKFRDYGRLLGDERVGLLTGDIVIRRDAPCRVMTTEILRNMLLSGESLEALGAVVIDEIHFLDDRERGTTWEELLIYLPPSVQVLGLSATLANARAFAAWLSQVRKQEVHVVREDRRAVPLKMWIANLEEGLLAPREFDERHRRWARKHHEAMKVVERGQRGRSGRGGGDRGGRRRGPARFGPATTHADVFDLLVQRDLLPCLHFSFSRKQTESHARSLARRLRRSLLDATRAAELRARLDAFARSEAGHALEPELREMYEKGVAFHHAGLNVNLKALVEELYEARTLDVLYCTSTFALGINLPARTAVFEGLKKFDGTSTRPLRTREFMQKAGRAGRRGMDEVGHVVIRMDHEEWEELGPLLAGYANGEPEPVRSSFSLSFNSVVNLLSRNPPERVREIVDHSFLAFTRGEEAKRLERDAERLQRDGAGHRVEKDAAKLRRRAAAATEACWEEFQRKVRFLQEVGYLDAEGGLNAGGRVLRSIQIEEIFVTEMILDGLLEDLPPPVLYGLLCAVNKEFGRDVRTRLQVKGGDAKVAREAERVRFGPVVRGAEAVSGVEATWCPAMIPFGRLWAEGRSLAELSTQIESSADVTGDLVGAFRRAKDLAGQLLDVYAEQPDRVERLRALIRDVSRDEVLVVD